jgi:hypothetical protein
VRHFCKCLPVCTLRAAPPGSAGTAAQRPRARSPRTGAGRQVAAPAPCLAGCRCQVHPQLAGAWRPAAAAAASPAGSGRGPRAAGRGRPPLQPGCRRESRQSGSPGQPGGSRRGWQGSRRGWWGSRRGWSESRRGWWASRWGSGRGREASSRQACAPRHGGGRRSAWLVGWLWWWWQE